MPAVSLVPPDPVCGLCPELTLPSAAPQLPVVSVVRDAEPQLLPDVGAVVTCKVGSQSVLQWQTAQPLLSLPRADLCSRARLGWDGEPLGLIHTLCTTPSRAQWVPWIPHLQSSQILAWGMPAS